MSPSHIFISHAARDDEFVIQLRMALEDLGLSVWVDSRSLRGGDKLVTEIEEAIGQARQVLVVLSPNTVNSPWVRREISLALEVEKLRHDEGYRVIPLLLPGIEPAALGLWFPEEPLGIRISLESWGVIEALPQVLAALGERLPDDLQQPLEPEAAPIEELVLELTDTSMSLTSGERRVTAAARRSSLHRVKTASLRRCYFRPDEFYQQAQGEVYGKQVEQTELQQGCRSGFADSRRNFSRGHTQRIDADFY